MNIDKAMAGEGCVVAAFDDRVEA
ncbi:MAG: hypothetical protein JWN51_1178, partial [Phycisphaerales bacterium]|nr:hypothetical protein [Phycisphaerales bacterium]